MKISSQKTTISSKSFFQITEVFRQLTASALYICLKKIVFASSCHRFLTKRTYVRQYYAFYEPYDRKFRILAEMSYKNN